MKRWTLSPSDKGAVENSSVASSTAAENEFQSTFLVFQRALHWDADAADTSHLMVVLMGRWSEPRSSPTDGFAAGVAVRPRVQFDVSCEYEEEGDDGRKGVPPKRKNAMEVLLPGRSGGPRQWGALSSDCICSLGRRVVGVATERLQS